MNALSKKLCGALLAVISAVCLSAGIFFTVRLNVSAETSVVLGDAKYYEISGGTCAGLSAEGENIASAEKNVVLQIPDGVTTIGMSAFKDCEIIRGIGYLVGGGVAVDRNTFIHSFRRIENVDERFTPVFCRRRTETDYRCKHCNKYSSHITRLF